MWHRPTGRKEAYPCQQIKCVQRECARQSAAEMEFVKSRNFSIYYSHTYKQTCFRGFEFRSEMNLNPLRAKILHQTPIWVDGYTLSGTGWRRPIECLKLQVIFRKRATNYRALLQKTICEDQVPYDSTPPCSASNTHVSDSSSLYTLSESLTLTRSLTHSLSHSLSLALSLTLLPHIHLFLLRKKESLTLWVTHSLSHSLSLALSLTFLPHLKYTRQRCAAAYSVYVCTLLCTCMYLYIRVGLCGREAVVEKKLLHWERDP